MQNDGYFRLPRDIKTSWKDFLLLFYWLFKIILQQLWFIFLLLLPLYLSFSFFFFLSFSLFYISFNISCRKNLSNIPLAPLQSLCLAELLGGNTFDTSEVLKDFIVNISAASLEHAFPWVPWILGWKTSLNFTIVCHWGD